MAPAELTPLPVIDLGPFTIPGYTASTKEDVLKQVAEVCETLGCFYLKNHGVDHDLIKNTIKDLRSFFALPADYKQKFVDPLGDVNRGYVPSEGQNLNRFMGREGLPNDPVEKYLCAPPQSDVTKVVEHLWPDQPPSFKSNVMKYFDSMKQLGTILMHVFSQAMQAPGYEDFVYRQCASGEHRLKMHLYGQKAAMKPGQVDRFPEHTDSVPFAILIPDACRGELKVLDDRDKKWISVTPIENMYVVNLGDSMARWTNGRWKAPVHKVTWPETDQEPGRVTLVYLTHARPDSMLEAIPAFVPEGQKPKYEPISYIDYVGRKVKALE